MSRIGYKAVELPAGVEVKQDGNVVTVKGPKGELTREFSDLIKINVEGNVVTFERSSDDNKSKSLHGTTRANSTKSPCRAWMPATCSSCRMVSD